MSFSQWPTKNEDGHRRPTQGVTIPWRWLRQFRRDLLWLKQNGYAENESHAVVRAVCETAARLREDQ